jgi:hypothetical protein
VAVTLGAFDHGVDDGGAPLEGRSMEMPESTVVSLRRATSSAWRACNP